MEGTAKATIAIDNKLVTFEGPQEFVDAQVEKYMVTVRKSGLVEDNHHGERLPDLNADAVTTERQLVLTKDPKGHSETVAVLAFALAQTGKTVFTAPEMRAAYIRAGQKPPKVIGQAIRDAKNGPGYINVGNKHGSYKLSDEGDRTVRFDLPRRRKHGE